MTLCSFMSYAAPFPEKCLLVESAARSRKVQLRHCLSGYGDLGLRSDEARIAILNAADERPEIT
ncbi:hypothetical protein JMJ56_31260 [Belnapia sp. T18]|uniref:Uncharacterized protein n=1 Tax=Belnapia arida TaxID=2804533 RepID=A0ABS1UFH2_9PROT|nr:hypothetical protein [Belnapia arida]MBL6082447.1 hypothetical protein [Belnapia arida]